MRATSSMRSISRVRSAPRSNGTRTVRASGSACTTSQPSRVRTAADSSGATSMPSTRGTRACRIVTGGRSAVGTRASRVPGTRRAGQLHQQPAGAAHGARRQLARQPLLEARARLGAQAEPQRGLEDRGAVERRRLEQHRACVLPDLGELGAEDARDDRRPPGVADREHRGIEGPLLPVEGDDALLCRPAARPRAALEAVEVEGVERLAGQQHDRSS